MGLKIDNCKRETGAGNETRTRDPDLGKVVLYQLSYSRLISVFTVAVGTSGNRFFLLTTGPILSIRETCRSKEAPILMP